MALLDDPLPVQARRLTALAEDDRIEAQSHRAALVGKPALIGQEVDHEVRRVGVELRGAGAGEPADVLRVLDHRTLHAQTDAEIRYAPLARVADRLDLAADSAIAEAARYQDAVDAGELRLGAVALDVLGVDPLHVDPRLVGDAAVGDRLDPALV